MDPALEVVNATARSRGMSMALRPRQNWDYPRSTANLDLARRQ
jgi:hypothetical protein